MTDLGKSEENIGCRVKGTEETSGKSFWISLRIAYRKIVDFLLLGFRTLELFVIFLPPILTSPLLIVSGKPRHWWRLTLVFSLQKAGPAFQKLGQWASTRPDLFGAPTRADLEHFHSDVPPEPWSRTVDTLTEAGLMNVFFDSIDVKPVGAGCIAQVHRARLNGKEVAVKIRRHDVKHQIIRDTDLLCSISSWAERLIPPLRVFGVAEVALNISEFLRSQLDLTVEGKNLTRFTEMFKTGPCAGEVAFPEPILAHETVLVETFEHGMLLSKVLALDHKSPVSMAFRKQLAQVGVRSFLEMVIVQNFCHADAHPGNIMIRTTPPFDPSKPDLDYKLDKLVYVDAGLVNELSPKDQVNFVDLFAAVADGDGERAANLMIDRSRDPSSCVDRDGFVLGMSLLINQVQLDSFRLDRVRIGDVLEHVMTLVHRHHVRLEPNFTSLIVSIIVLEGVGRQLDPELDIFRTSVPMLLRAQQMYKQAAFSAVVESVTNRRRKSRKNST